MLKSFYDAKVGVTSHAFQILSHKRNAHSAYGRTTPFLETVDSARYFRHLSYLSEKDHQVLEVLGWYDGGKDQVRTQEGKWVAVPPIGIYSAVYKDEHAARAIFNVGELNEKGKDADLRVRILGGHRFVARA